MSVLCTEFWSVTCSET